MDVSNQQCLQITVTVGLDYGLIFEFFGNVSVIKFSLKYNTIKSL